MSVCPRTYFKNRSVLLRRLFSALCTSGFVDDVVFAHNRPDKGDASRTSAQGSSPWGNATLILIRVISVQNEFLGLMSTEYETLCVVGTLVVGEGFLWFFVL